jgi:hypothetical protein
MAGASVAAASTALVQAQPIKEAPSTPGLSNFQKEIIKIISTLNVRTGSGAHKEKSPFSLPSKELYEMIASYCGPLTPEEEVSQLYHQEFVRNVRLKRLARLPVVTGATLDVDKNLPWFVDVSFPEVDVTKMSAAALRGESSIKHTLFGPMTTLFIAIRYTSNRSPTVQKVEFIFQGSDGSGWGQNLFGWSTRVTPDDYARLRDLLDGKQIQGAPECANTHAFSDERFQMA